MGHCLPCGLEWPWDLHNLDGHRQVADYDDNDVDDVDDDAEYDDYDDYDENPSRLITLRLTLTLVIMVADNNVVLCPVMTLTLMLVIIDHFDH